MTLTPKFSYLAEEIRLLINESRTQVSRKVNSALIHLNWQIGQRVEKEILSSGRGAYGKNIIEELSRTLSKDFPNMNARNLWRMVQFYKVFSDLQILSTLSTELSWSHFVELISIEEASKRQFYLEFTRSEKWSVRQLQKHKQSQMYERTILSTNPEGLIKKELGKIDKEKLSPTELIFKDPYVLDFLELKREYSESDLENAILDELCQFLQEMGNDFCFIARQKRMNIGKEDFYLDLLMFHRGLSRLVALELKIGKFAASYKGQMELYLNWLNKYEKKPHENEPIGIILCTEKDQEQIELLEMKKSKIHVAEYITKLPDKKFFEQKLDKAINIARNKIAKREQKNVCD